MTRTREYSANFDHPNPVPQLAEVAAIAGDALCKSSVDCYMRLATKGGEVDPHYPYNKITLRTNPPPSSRKLFIGSRGNKMWCETSEEDVNGDLTLVRLVPDPDNPGQLVRVHNSEEEQSLAVEPATYNTALSMVRSVANAAGPLREAPPPWGLTGDNRNVDFFMLSATRLVPVVGHLLHTIGNFLAEAPRDDGVTTSSRLAVDVGASGRVYGPNEHQISLSTNNPETRRIASFNLTFRYSAGTPSNEFSIVRCSLDQNQTTKDILLQHWTELWRVRSERQDSGEFREVGRYPANEQTIVKMAQAAMTGADVFAAEQADN